MSKEGKVPEKIIFICFIVGFLAIITNAVYLLFKIFFVLSSSSDIKFASCFFFKEFVIFYVNILTGIIYIFFGFSLLRRKKWACLLYNVLGLLIFIPVLIIVYIVDPLLLKYGFGPKLFN